MHAEGLCNLDLLGVLQEEEAGDGGGDADAAAAGAEAIPDSGVAPMEA